MRFQVFANDEIHFWQLPFKLVVYATKGPSEDITALEITGQLCNEGDNLIVDNKGFWFHIYLVS